MYITMKTKAYLYPTSIFIDHALCNNSTLMFMEHAQEWFKLSINLIIMTIHLEIEKWKNEQGGSNSRILWINEPNTNFFIRQNIKFATRTNSTFSYSP